MARKKKVIETEEKAPVAYVREETVKESAVKKLSARGINAFMESGVVMMKIKDENEMTELKEVLKSIGYDQSYGFKICKGDNNDEVRRSVESTQSEGSEDHD